MKIRININGCLNAYVGIYIDEKAGTVRASLQAVDGITHISEHVSRNAAIEAAVTALENNIAETIKIVEKRA